MKKKLAVIIALLLVIAIVIGITVSNLKFRGDLTEISSEKQLQKIWRQAISIFRLLPIPWI